MEGQDSNSIPGLGEHITQVINGAVSGAIKQGMKDVK